MNFYPRHVGDYMCDAGHLSLLEHGVYTRLMDVYYTREAPIPDDQKYRLIGARSEEELRAVDTILMEFFTKDGDSWVQSRCEVELEAFNGKRNQASKAANARWGKAKTEDVEPEHMRTQCETDAGAMRTHSERNADAMQAQCGRNATITITNTITKELNTQWFLGERSDLAAEIVNRIRAAKGYEDFDPDEGPVVALVDFVSKFAPDDEAVTATVDAFVDRANKHRGKKPEYVDPLRAIREWCKRSEAAWRSVRRQREIDAERSAKKNGKINERSKLMDAVGLQ